MRKNDPHKKEQIILDFLSVITIASRKALVELSGIPRTTVYDTLTRLQLKNQVFRLKQKERTLPKGRKKVYWTTKPELS